MIYKSFLQRKHKQRARILLPSALFATRLLMAIFPSYCLNLTQLPAYHRAKEKQETKAQRKRGLTKADSARAARRVRENLSAPPFCWLSGPRGCGQHFISMLHLQEGTGREGSLRVFVLPPLLARRGKYPFFKDINHFPLSCSLLAVLSGRDCAPNLYSWRGSVLAPLPAAIKGQGCMRCVLSDMQANKSGRRANNK